MTILAIKENKRRKKILKTGDHTVTTVDCKPGGWKKGVGERGSENGEK